MIIDKNLQDTMKDLRKFLSEDWKALKASPARLAKSWKRFYAEAEAGKQAYDENQARQWQEVLMAQQALISQSELMALKKYWAYILAKVPYHLNFWGALSAEVLNITYNNFWHLILPASTTANDLPSHFHSFRAELSKVADSVRQFALEELRFQIQADVDLWQRQQIEALHTGIFRGKSDHQMQCEYAATYRALAPLLHRIEDLAVTPTGTGVEISFSPVYDDAGLSPDRYYDNVNSLM